MKLVVLESPYAGDIERNVTYARRCLHDCLIRGESPIASHLLFTQPGVLDDNKSEERALGIKAGLAWVPRADYSVYYTDLGWSNGMRSALYLAIRNLRPIKIRKLDKLAAWKLPSSINEDMDRVIRQSCEE